GAWTAELRARRTGRAAPELAGGRACVEGWRETSMRWGIAAGILAHALVWDTGLARAGELALGMSQREVVFALGPPIGVHLERNAVVCLAYEACLLWRWAHLFGERRRVIGFREGRGLDEAHVRSLRPRCPSSRLA